MVPTIVGLVAGAMYYFVAFRLIGRFKVDPKWRFLVVSIPIGVFSVVWILSALTYHSYDGIMIPVMLAAVVPAAWWIHKVRG